MNETESEICISFFFVFILVIHKRNDTSEMKGAGRSREGRHRGRLRGFMWPLGFYVTVCPVYVSLPLLSSPLHAALMAACL